MGKKQKAPALQTVKQYLENKNVLENTLFRYSKGKGHYVFFDAERNELLLTVEEAKELFPTAPRVGYQHKRWKGENPNGTKSYI